MSARTAAAPPIEVVTSIEDACYVLKVGLGADASAAVLKILGFDNDQLVPCAEVAVDLAANISNGELIIDVIGNGGGWVDTGYDLNHYLYANMPHSPMKETFQACEWYDLPQIDALDWFVSLAEHELPRLSDARDPRQEIVNLIHRMDRASQSLTTSSDSFGRVRKVEQLQNSSACLQTLILKFGTPSAPRKETDEWIEFDGLYKQCVALAKPLGGSRGMHIMGYAPSNKYPKQMSPPTWDYYTSTVVKVHGGTNRKFSSMAFLHDCKGYAAAYPKVFDDINLASDPWPYPPQTKLRHIKYLSDGTCGSTCSVSSSTPYLEGLSTFVTFGGVKDEPMDITSFNGGNSATYQAQEGDSLWKMALDSFVDAGVFYPESKPPTYPFLPIPLNLDSASFTQRAEYPRPLGPKALPREWYLVPASYHLNMWTSSDLYYYDKLSASERSTLYELYSATAAKVPRPFVQT